MLERKIEQVLSNWKACNDVLETRKGLIITGARQVGKTSSIEKFARGAYENVIKIDFAEQPELMSFLSAAQGVDDLSRRITSLANKPVIPGQTLVFIDEVQLQGDAITWIKYLVQAGRFDVVMSGSMLGVEVYDFRSLPVGFVQIEEMFPLDFEEFCWSQGLSKETFAMVRECFENRTPVDDWLHDRMMRLFNLYVLVGGMPEPLQAFVQSQDTQLMRSLQHAIVEAYRVDISRYVNSPLHSQRIRAIYDAIPAQLNKENKRFVLNDINKDRRFAEMEVDFEWLRAAGVALSCLRTSEPTFPIRLNLDHSKFKLYLSDVGLLFSFLSDADVRQILSQDARINFGMIYENAVAQELRAHGHNLVYYNSKKYGEVDFLIEQGKPQCTLIEVKSGRGSESHRALDKLMAVENYEIDEAFVLHPGNVRCDGRVTYMPVYFAAFL